MSTGQGGMIALNDKEIYEWLKKARDHGLDLSTEQRYKGKYAQYDVEFVGWRVKPDDIRAAIGIEQLKKLPENTKKRNRIVKIYNEALGYKRTGNHLYIVFVKDQEKFMDYMMSEGIQCALHYRPLHTMTAYQYFPKDELPNTEWLGKHAVSLPLYPQMTDAEVSKVILAAKSSKQLIHD